MTEAVDITGLPSSHEEAWKTLGNQSCHGLRGDKPCRRIDIALGAIGYQELSHQLRLAEVSAKAKEYGGTFCDHCPILVWAEVHLKLIGKEQYGR